MKSPLTKKQQNIYSYVRQYFTEHEQSPTLDELRTHAKVKSLNTVVDHLKSLEQKGYIVRRKHAKRNIELRDVEPRNNNSTWTVTIPVIASVGCDDLSTFATDQARSDESIHVDSKLVEGKGNVVAVRAIGNSMNDAGIEDGDYVLVQPTQHAKSGERVVAIVGDMITVKKLERANGITILRPESNDPKYKPIILSGDFQISGKVICTIPSETRDIMEVVPLQNHA